jgi:UDP-3-O-[3-hydroxymyristoyl] glucosamine N-acyltransferase
VRIASGCRLGENVTVFANAVLYENTVVGNRVLIHAGAVIGCYGFGYVTREGRHALSAQLGAVTIGDDVEIGAGTTVDRGTYGNTSIGCGTKIDNQVHIGHNCRIGRHNLLCAQVGIAGSCTTGDYAVMAGQVGLKDHIDVGHRAVVGAKSGVMHNVADGEVVLGIPATPSRQQMIQQVAVGKLPELRKELKVLTKRVELLEQLLRREAA